MNLTPIVEFTNVSKRFPNGTTALASFSMTIADGEFVSLLGPSGCGKSTALRMIAGLTSPSAGRLHRRWDHPDPKPRQKTPPVSCVFQEPTLMPWATVWQNVYLPLRLQGQSSLHAKAAVADALALVGLAPFADAYPRELSGGMKMRASVARALLTHPQLLLLDEPFAALDEITRAQLNEDLMVLWRQRRWAGLFITHSVYEAVFLSTRVLVMSPRPGRVVAEILVDLPAERTADVRLSPEYLQLCRRVSAALASAPTPTLAGTADG